MESNIKLILEAMRRSQLEIIAKEDPTLLLLKQVLEREQEIMQMDGAALLRYATDLRERYENACS